MKSVSIQLSLFILCISCRYSDDRLKIQNISKIEIAVEFSGDTIPMSLNKAEFLLNEKISPGEIRPYSQRGVRDSWPRFIRLSKNQKLNIFVYRVDTIKKYMDMGHLREKKLYERMVSFSEAELNEMHWLVSL